MLPAFLEGPNPNVVFLYGVKKYYNLNSPTVQFELQIAWKTAGLFREVCIFLWLTRKTIVILKSKWWSHVAPAHRLTVDILIEQLKLHNPEKKQPKLTLWKIKRDGWKLLTLKWVTAFPLSFVIHFKCSMQHKKYFKTNPNVKGVPDELHNLMASILV